MKKIILNTILFLLSLNLLAQSPAYPKDTPKVNITAKGIEKGNIKVTKEQLLKAQELIVKSKLSKYEILGFDVNYSNREGTFIRKNNASLFNETTINAIKSVEIGGIIIFNNIQVKETKAESKTITISEPLIYKIIE